MDNNKQQSDDIAELVRKDEAERRVNTRRKFITLLISGCGYACWWWHRYKTNRRSVKVDVQSFLEAQNPQAARLMSALKHSGPIIGPNGQCYNRDATITLPGGAKMEMIYCPPGEFMMGSEVDDNMADSDEKTLNGKHKVLITHGFWLGKYEVTQEQWVSVMGNNPSYFKSPTRPVEKVSWFDCQEFISKVANEVRRQLGGYACLPTEAEWEYACRAGTNKSLPNGPDGKEIRIQGGKDECLNEIAWYNGNSCVGFELSNVRSKLSNETKECEDVKAGTHPVGGKAPNNWGFYDMIGNVREWCNDWYASEYYSNGIMSDPIGPSSGDVSRTFGECRVLRGGAWSNYAQLCRSANRHWSNPSYHDYFSGFRLCCSTEPRG